MTGDKVGCGDVLYRVDDKPVLLLCGTVPAYRVLHDGERATTSGSSTATCARSATPPDLSSTRPTDTFTSETTTALERLAGKAGRRRPGR